jgi:hypothetical protein
LSWRIIESVPRTDKSCNQLKDLLMQNQNETSEERSKYCIIQKLAFINQTN